MKSSYFKSGLVLGTILAGLLASSTLQAQDLASAKLLTNGEKYGQAEQALNQLIQKDPSNSKAYFYLGENYLLDYFSDTISNSLSDYTSKAKDAFEKGVSANASDPINYAGLAKVANIVGDERTAEQMREKAKSYLMPYKKVNKKMVPAPKDYALTLAKLADSYLWNGVVDTAKALPLIRQAISIDPTNPDIYIIAGDIYIAVNDGSNAIKNYNEAQYYDPSSPLANIKIGNIYVRGKSLSAAIPYFEEAISIDKDFAPAYRELGSLYWSAGRLEQSKQNYQKYLDLTQGNIPAKIQYVNSLFYAKDYDEVINNVEDILKVDNSRGYLNRLIGYSYFDKKNPDYDKAAEYMNKLKQVVSEDKLLWKDHYYLARIKAKQNQDYVATLTELNNTKDEAKKAELQAKVNAMEKSIAEAFSEYDKVIEARPDEKSLKNEIANQYYSFRMFDKAAKMWEKNLDPVNPSVNELMQIGRAYYNGDFYKEAEDVFNRVIQKQNDYLPARVYMARTYSKMDDNNTGIPKPKFEDVIKYASADSVKNASEMMEAFRYLGYYYMQKDNYNTAKAVYERMINLVPGNSDNQVTAYKGLASVETNQATKEAELDNKLVYLTRAENDYKKVLELAPNDASAKSSLKWVQDYQSSIRKGINPNEIRGKITDRSGKPIGFASIRVKDTAAENLTKSNGEFRFEIPQSAAVLIISAQGHATKEIPLTSSRVYNVVLD